MKKVIKKRMRSEPVWWRFLFIHELALYLVYCVDKAH